MKLTFVASHFCIRAVKQALALRPRGFKINGIGFKRPQFFENLDLFVRCAHNKHLDNAVKLLEPHTDVWYVHTEPYNLVWKIREHSKKPILLDMHDSMQWRTPNKHGWTSAEERATMPLVDGFVVPSQKCKQLTPVNKPMIVLPPYVNEQFYQYHCLQWLGGLVYEGRADKRSQKSFMDYCKYHDLAKKCLSLNLPFYLYSCWNDEAHIAEYKNALTMPTESYQPLLKKLSSHDWGLCGNIGKHREWNLAMPNKLFEYMAAGIPIVAMNASEVSKFIKKYKVGITVKSIEELMERWDEREECQSNVLKIRHKFTMENNIGPLAALLRDLLHRAK